MYIRVAMHFANMMLIVVLQTQLIGQEPKNDRSEFPAIVEAKLKAKMLELVERNLFHMFY